VCVCVRLKRESPDQQNWLISVMSTCSTPFWPGCRKDQIETHHTKPNPGQCNRSATVWAKVAMIWSMSPLPHPGNNNNSTAGGDTTAAVPISPWIKRTTCEGGEHLFSTIRYIYALVSWKKTSKLLINESFKNRTQYSTILTSLWKHT